MSPEPVKTPEDHTNELLNALQYEVDTYGPRSAIEVLATVLEGLEDAEADRYAALLRRLS